MKINSYGNGDQFCIAIIIKNSKAKSSLLKRNFCKNVQMKNMLDEMFFSLEKKEMDDVCGIN